ncbi:MAG TPA: LamG-like jellyroll fold domain-containing protein, partial [Saprospiraceae bacterium]|nr:LamG-like jellyroll fold domain-containing protein [Saprospiraceae bacterium]
LLLLLGLPGIFINAQVTQINIPRIELMPNEPVPFNVRDWKSVATKYDSFIYDINKTGQYLPFVSVKASGVNYPQNPSFSLHTYVGTNTPNGNESINVLPSLVGASLAGIDKSNQFGKNWVLMSQDFFNKSNGEQIYLNNQGGGSGGDWWYDLMPNIYFYQLYNLYPTIGGDAEYQFNTIADKFLESVRKLGGSDTPWQPADMNYRAFNFKTGEPNGVGAHEPEAAGAYAWVLYNAYHKTGNKDYLKGAEWSMEFLNGLTSNPSYELQLPYGTYTAARMNAELGTNYDIEKMINWSFNKGPLRGWGTIVGNWGGFNVSGLIGEANDQGNDYAFQMNGLHQVAMLAPLVRYDKRFARAIGKWILNLANANRLYYPGFLPNSLQDSYQWSNIYDIDHVIGYEALREKWMGMSPFSTGDAIKGGWAKTNLALYGTSSIGYLGAILEKTNVDKILRIDLHKTDFFQEKAYPTYLYFNPFAIPKTVELAVGSTPIDIYNALTESFILKNVSGTINLDIPANGAVLVSLTPAGGTVSYNHNQMLVDNVVVDYNQSIQSYKYPPRIQALASAAPEVVFGDSTTIYSKELDKDSNKFTRQWSVTGGKISGTGATVQWIAPNVESSYTVTLIITDESNNKDTATLIVKAVPEINQAPQILKIIKSKEYTAPNGTIQLTCNAIDPNADLINYEWTSTAGSINGTGSTINWTAPNTEGVYQISVKVSDPKGLSSQITTNVLVKIFNQSIGNLIAYYPFKANANDVSGNNLHGQINGAIITTDIWGDPAKACLFDGLNDNITVANKTILNFTDAITVSAWFKPTNLPDHESFLLSHGSWQNRWKISFTPEKKIRWTVNTLNTVGDLDSEITVQKDSVYFLVASYDGSLMTMYINGVLQSYKALTGKIRTSPVDFLMGQILPGTTDYNYKGLLDEVKIMDYALTPEAIKSLYDNSVTLVNELKYTNEDLLVFPNPVTKTLNIQFSEEIDPNGIISIYSIEGNKVAEHRSLLDKIDQFDSKDWKAGYYIVTYRTSKAFGRTGFIKI